MRKTKKIAANDAGILQYYFKGTKIRDGAGPTNYWKRKIQWGGAGLQLLGGSKSGYGDHEELWTCTP